MDTLNAALEFILDLFKKGREREAEQQLRLLIRQLDRLEHYEKRLADWRLEAYQEVTSALVRFKSFSIRNSVFGQTADTQAMAECLVEARIAAEQYFPFFQMAVREEVAKVYELWSAALARASTSDALAMSIDISAAERAADFLQERIAREAGIEAIRQGFCLKCGYCLRGVTSKSCPECGTMF